MGNSQTVRSNLNAKCANERCLTTFRVHDKLSYFAPKLAATLLVTMFLYFTAAVPTNTKIAVPEVEYSDILQKQTTCNSDA
jgi:hypothetical protein